MAGLSNKDSSFFEIRSPETEVDEEVATADMISLTINEKMGEMTTGTLQMYDPNNVYVRRLRLGTTLRLAWGYRDIDASPRSLLKNIRNLDEFSDSIERRGLEVFVESPSGEADEEGNIRFSCNFTSHGMRGEDQVRKFDSGTKRSVVRQVLDELGVVQADIRFEQGSERVSDDASIRQMESNFAFLTRMAREWRTFFSMNYGQDGKLRALFVDPEYLGKSAYQSSVLGSFGASNLFEYKGEAANVISYSWQNNAGRSGTGDAAQLQIVDGKPQVQRFRAETQEVVTWRLNEEAIEAEFDRVESGQGGRGMIKLTRDLLSAQSFKEIERFFTPVESTTAPQGYGYEATIETLGNPLVMASNMAEFGGGFPEVLGSDDTNWYIREVSHKISRDGYKQTIKIADAFSFSETGTVL